MWNGVYLDIFIYPESKLGELGHSMIHMRGGHILLQRADVATRLLARLDEIHRQGPKPLALDVIEARKVWAHKMLERARCQDADGNYRRHWLLTTLLEDYFVMRGQWYEGSKESLKCLAINQPKLYDLFDQGLAPTASIREIEAFVYEVTGERG
jgi:hypothetical protein